MICPLTLDQDEADALWANAPALVQQCPRCDSHHISESIGSGSDAYWCHECQRLFHAPMHQ